MEPEKKLEQSDIGVLFHTFLFAYQKALRDALGPTAVSLVTEDAMPILEKMTGKISPEFLRAETLEGVLKKYTDLLVSSGFVERADVLKDAERYVFRVDGCVFAKHVHSELKPRT